MKKRAITLQKLLPEYLEFWKTICNMETPSSDKNALNIQADFIEKFAVAHGFTVRRKSHDRAGDTMSIELAADSTLEPIALLAHMDTVHEKGAFGMPPVTESEGVLYGPGVFDCKGGIAVAMLAMQTLAACGENHRTLRLILNSDEENGTYVGDAGVEFIHNEACGCCAAFNLEAGRADSLTVGRKGILKAEIIIHGVAGHAGNSYFESSSAIREAAHKIIDIESESEPDGITYNCGTITGGSVTNIVPAICAVGVDIRYKNAAQQQKAQAVLQRVTAQVSVPGCSAECKILHVRPAMECTEGNLALFEK
ncbi:MAG: M20/M25/M40 family metallo-hydrolase, partial [Clostridia bacterium]|nr:M20/M25/M40 family metallo-hydrolase [Clostridia bacterium]